MIESKKPSITVKIQGGLGNQLFQYAAARSLAINHDADLILDVSFYGAKRHRQFELARFPIVASCDGSVSRYRWVRSLEKVRRRILRLDPPLYKEPDLHSNSALQSISLPCVVSGYFQSPRYFEVHADQIRRELEPPEPLDKGSQELADIIVQDDAVSLHIRRGDYISNPKVRKLYAECSVDYYNAAIERTPGNGPVIVFSDDLDWPRQNLVLPRSTFFAGDYGKRSALADLWLMTKAHHHIIANSTFSWWGCWLAGWDKGLSIAPANWFADPKSTIDDLIPATWIMLEN